VQILPPWEDDPQQRLVYFHAFFASPDATIDNPTLAPVLAFPEHDVISIYARDRFSVLPNLTLNVGVRWEKQLIKGLNGITFIDVNHFSPRAGVTWDFLNDGRGKVYASYSNFVQIVPARHEHPVAERRARRRDVQLRSGRPHVQPRRGAAGPGLGVRHPRQPGRGGRRGRSEHPLPYSRR
jgi:hypothetical protein